MFHKFMGKHDKKEHEATVVEESPPESTEPKQQSADGPVQFAAIPFASLSTILSIERYFTFGGMANKKSKRIIFNIVPGTGNTFSFGGTTNKILNTHLGFNVIESCSPIMVYTATTNAPLRFYPACPSPDGTSLALLDITNATDGSKTGIQAADIALAAGESATFSVDGY